MTNPSDLHSQDDVDLAREHKTPPNELEAIWLKHKDCTDPTCCFLGPGQGWITDLIARNPSLPESMMRMICELASQSRDGDAAKDLISSVLMNPNCPPGLLESYSEVYFDDWIVEIIADHPNTPESVRQMYQDDFGL
jgi:hypothetical protein